MLHCGAPLQRFLQFIGHVSPYENSFTICHSDPSLLPKHFAPICAPKPRGSISRILLPGRSRAVIIRLGRPLPDGSSDLPGNASRITPGTRTSSPDFVSLFGLAPRGVCLAADVATRAGELLPHHFTHHLSAGLLSVALVVTRRSGRPAVNRLDALRCSDFPLQALRPEAITGSKGFRGVPYYNKSC